MISKIGKIKIYVNNQEDAKKFWTEKLDFVIKFEQQVAPRIKWIEVAPCDDESTSFILWDKNLVEDKQEANHPFIMLHTFDINETHEKLKSKGVEVGDITDMPYGKMFKFKDQDGNSYVIRPQLVK